jgi:type IV pilus assembly protein PilE
MRRHSRGVTLIELVVVVVIVGILAAIAVPSYQSYVLRSHRVEGKAALLAIAAAQEKFYLACNTYTDDLTGAVDESDCAARGLGFGDGDAGTDGVQTEHGWYTISFDDAPDATGYTLRADAIGAQTRDTECDFFTLDAQGARSAESTSCWN